MAANAAHISTTAQPKPTIFELWAQESLMSTLGPAFRLICDSTSFKNALVTKLAKNHNDETFLCINLGLQYYYLKNYNSSFSEAFYGLKRVGLNGEKLSDRQKLLSLMQLVAVPYLNEKVKKLQENEKNIKAVSSILFIVNSLKMYFYISYLVGNSSIYSIYQKLIGVKLVYQKRMDLSFKEIFMSILSGNRKSILQFIFKFLELGAFIVQFWSWWYNNQSSRSLTSYPTPTALDTVKSDICPLCKKKRKVEVVLQLSGYVFCYPCIKTYLDKNSKCPVTKQPANPNHLIRLYTDF